jgi:ribulose-phosphate 3-epimerase
MARDHRLGGESRYRLAPSILSADFARLGEEVERVVEAGCQLIHFDVMDNHYVPNLTIGPLVCEAIRPYAKVPIDVHLMVRPVDALVPMFAAAGADIISFHPEASDHADRTLALIRDMGCRAGLALNPATPLHHLDHVMDRLDLILVMSVNPGFGGQSFIPSALDKTRRSAGASMPMRSVAGRRSGWRWTEASSPATSAPWPMPARTASSPAPPSSARRTPTVATAAPSAGCARRWRRR